MGRVRSPKRTQSHSKIFPHSHLPSARNPVDLRFFKHIHLSAPFTDITHTEAIPDFSSGVATFLPRPFYALHHKIISPGFILSTTTSLQGLSCEIINVYLHPRKIHALGSALLSHLQSPDSRAHGLRILGGDFNQIDNKYPQLFQDLLLELNSAPPLHHPTYRRPDGYSSMLDYFLLQPPDNTSLSNPPQRITFWPSYQPHGHGIHVCKFPRTPPVSPSCTSR